ncbi:DNA-directed DNA polymerase [Limosilactobacillus frumenti DSM 13145]|uniref:DNA-directed DNA polymerase n=1 Tax=Limosilactobacillus frumenti DSM 13145 TaxID=1423746 RepID=A0A0R1P862_9LACO|nr:DNA polymerase III subunit delta' [Limosilactobacillus frumenti]KRL28377.1 DNA-directed DNA polymerase [Limosilactobacillus frumenti DSM 13145]MBA2913758.1 DNA polymerase III subunit delta' [Limosilactobacillus frumenti]QFG72169.1 DNA polymerase III subunit delta' [Limosilactobacillus frumenti]
MEAAGRAQKLQPAIVDRFRLVMANHELAHAYLFVGPAGSGKTAIARWLALRLFCLHPDQNGEPDYTCPECQRIISGNHPDVVIAQPEGRQIKVDEVRRLKAEFTKSAMEGNQKLFVIHDAEKMTTSAANSLLKFIEEPGPGIYILMLTTNQGAVLPTIRSRTQVVELQPLSRTALADTLAELEIPAVERAVGMGLTDSILDIQQWQENDWLKQAIEAVSLWYRHASQGNMLAFVDVATELMKLAKDRGQQQRLLDMLALIWRDTLLMANGVADERDQHFINVQDQLQKVSDQYPVATLLRVSELTLESRRLFDQNIAFQNIAEQLTIRICQALTR